MKLGTSNTFDISQIADTKTFEEISPFFDYVNGFTSDVVQAFSKRITFTENMSYASLPLTLQHGTPTNIGKYSPIGVFFKSETPILSYSLTTNADSTVSLSVYFKETHNSFTKSATWQAGTIVRYQVQDVSPLSVGDAVKITNFSNISNNGVFLVLEIDADNNYIYVSNRNRTSATGDEIKVGYSGSPLTKRAVTIGLVLA